MALRVEMNFNVAESRLRVKPQKPQPRPGDDAFYALDQAPG
ncbi:hypothetical protein [Bradyrhizobium erythrophlei]|jgi:hypothetical protein|nr:hypothetical protein [Bradyrhizobium erythrophlei]